MKQDMGSGGGTEVAHSVGDAVSAGPTFSLDLESGGTKFNDLQTVVKEKIFSYLDPLELQCVRTVCRNWFYLINHKFGIRAVIDNRNTELLQLSPWIVDVQLLSLTRPFPAGGICFGDRVKKVVWRGIVVSYNLFPFLQSCPHVESLTFDEPTIDLPLDVLRTLSPAHLSLPACAHLEFLCWNLTESLITILSILSAVEFGSLREIEFRSVHPPMLPLGLLFAPAPVPHAGDHPLMTLILRNLQSLTTLSLGTPTLLNKLIIIPRGEGQMHPIQLTELHLHNLYLSWTSILQDQATLTILSIGHCQAQQWPEIRTCITRCQTTLRKVELQGRTFGLPWDNDVFVECECLEELQLNLSLSPKRLLSQLPLSLRELAIDGPIDLQEIGQLRHLTSLRKLLLNSLGLNLLILFPGGNVDEGEEQTEVINLPLFVDLILSLSSLQVLQFRDCAQDAVEWDMISRYCRALSTEIPAITFRCHYYDIHGQPLQHGLTLNLPPDFNREQLRIPGELGGISSSPHPPPGFLGNVLRMFGL